MATKVIINGKAVTRPGVYATVKSGINVVPGNIPYGTALIIDDGIGAGWGAGSGSLGVLKTGRDSVYSFADLDAAQAFLKGGELWHLASALFKPAAIEIAGISQLLLIQARATTRATITYTLTNGSVAIQPKDEGVNANGVASSSILRRGYGAKLIAGVTASTAILQIYAGTYKGIDALNNTPYEFPEASSAPLLIDQSPEVANLTELKAWMDASAILRDGFTYTITLTTGLGVITSGDISANTGFKLAAGATETYSGAAFTEAIEAVSGLNIEAILGVNSDPQSANNVAIVESITASLKYKPVLFIAGGNDKTEFTSVSIAAAAFYNSSRVAVVHGDFFRNTRTGNYRYNSLYKAAAVIGRSLGLEPQVSCTFKSIAIDNEVHNLTDAEQETALSKGVLCTIAHPELGYHVVLQGVNTLLENEFLINSPSGESHDLAVNRITAYLNAELIVNGTKKFFGSATSGTNRATFSQDEVKVWVSTFLKSRTARANEDNLIIRVESITISVNQDVYNINYSYVPNYPINKVIFSGVILEA